MDFTATWDWPALCKGVGRFSGRRALSSATADEAGAHGWALVIFATGTVGLSAGSFAGTVSRAGDSGWGRWVWVGMGLKGDLVHFVSPLLTGESFGRSACSAGGGVGREAAANSRFLVPGAAAASGEEPA